MKVFDRLVIGVVLLLVACSAAPAGTRFPVPILVAPPEPTIDLNNCSTTICCDNRPAIPVHRVIGGDTFVSGNGRVQLYGVDTPESGEGCFTEAAKRFAELAGDSVRVEFGHRQGDQYGRILYYVYTSGGESMDEILIREGLALAWTRDGQHRDQLNEIEKKARMERTGCLWVLGLQP